eukprot:3798697-Pleurochrysis_carterae.AAC.1
MGGSGHGNALCLLAIQMRAMPDLLLGPSLHGIPFLAVAGRIVLRVALLAATRSTAGRCCLRFLYGSTALSWVLGGWSAAME